MGSLLFKFSGCANRGLMAQKRSPFQPGRSEPGKSENWGRPSGGTDFLIARTGGDFNVPIRKAAWRAVAAVIDNGLDLEIVVCAAALQGRETGWLDKIAALLAARDAGRCALAFCPSPASLRWCW
jgi:hypothetical protein